MRPEYLCALHLHPTEKPTNYNGRKRCEVPMCESMALWVVMVAP